MTHIIQKQVLELTLDEGTNRVALHDDMVRNFKESTVNALSRLFDKLAPENLIYKIDKLEVDLGQIAPEDFEKELISQIEKLLQTQLIKHPEINSKALKAISKEQGIFQQFLYFLKKGHFSWNANGISLAQMERELPAIFAGITNEQRKELRLALRANSSLERLKAQFSKKYHSNLAAALLPFNDYKVWEKIFAKVLPKPLHSSISFQAISVYVHYPKISEPQFIAKWFAVLTMRSRLIDKEVEALQRKLLNEAKTALPKVALKLAKAFEEEKEVNLEIYEEGTAATEPQQDTESNIIYIKNAGLVLLWPYLQRFFGNLKLTDGIAFKDRESTEKAVRILHFLVSPDEPLAENLLPLAKILCGLDVNDLVPTIEEDGRLMTITTEEVEAGKELIKAVIENWGTIGSTSVKGFQNSFLQREGRLENDDPTAKAGQAGWKLKVEQRTYDMLLDSLPWNINLIKLPWMPKPLHVEW